MKKILVICGATASGKTSFAVNMALRLRSEIISADCMLIYKGFDIGTAKPTPEEKKGVPHHMIDIIEPTQNFSVSDYEHSAEPISERILSENRVPIICGGTGFYIQSILFRRSLGGVGSDLAVRKKYESIAESEGKEALFALLEKTDAETAQKLHPNDVKRVVRALEIYELTGKKKSQQQDGFTAKRPYVAVAFDYPRDELYRRIDQRVDSMLAEGLVDEVRGLLFRGVTQNCQAMQGIGYKEVVEYLNGGISYSTMSDKIKQNTRNYAKRQITLFKKFPGLLWLNPKEKNNAEKVLELIK